MERFSGNSAFWISPKGKILKVTGATHIKKVIENPEGFGLTEKKINNWFLKYKEPIGHEGYAREEIIKKLVYKGFIRVREYQRPNGYWSINLNSLNRKNKDFIKQLAYFIYNKRRNFHEEFKLSMPHKKEIRITILDILMDKLEKNYMKNLPNKMNECIQVEKFDKKDKLVQKKRFDKETEDDWDATPEELYLYTYWFSQRLSDCLKLEIEKKSKSSNYFDFIGALDAINKLTQERKNDSPDRKLIKKNKKYQKRLLKLIKKLDLYKEKKWDIQKDNTPYFLWLTKRWHDKVGEAWYGLAGLSGRVPLDWLKFIHEVLRFLETYDPEFYIKQIKIKFGSIRFYVSTDLDLNDLTGKMSSVFYLKELEY